MRIGNQAETLNTSECDACVIVIVVVVVVSEENEEEERYTNVTTREKFNILYDNRY